MKDLYTFDSTKGRALETYEIVQRAYTAFFDEFKIPYLVAEADSGDIGGDLSHEYHFPTPKGEDNIISCTSCSFTANEEEVAKAQVSHPRIASSDTEASLELESVATDPVGDSSEFRSWYGVSRSGHFLLEAIYPAETRPGKTSQINPFALKQLFPELDLGVESPIGTFILRRKGAQDAGFDEPRPIYQIFDYRVTESQMQKSFEDTARTFSKVDLYGRIQPKWSGYNNTALELLRLSTGDPCPKCAKNTLEVQPAVELGHTFFLGTKYTEPLHALIDPDPSEEQVGSDRVPMQMGCHGIGVSRLIAAVADSLSDPVGLNWPRVMAPFEVVVVPYLENLDSAQDIYDLLSAPSASASASNTETPSAPTSAIDAIIDDRDRSFVWKLKDADLIGYPIVVLLGKTWKTGRKAEVRCRRLGVKTEVEAGEVRGWVEGMLRKL